jgi:putative sporulation protein YtxC
MTALAQVVLAVKHAFPDLQKRLEEGMFFFQRDGFSPVIKEEIIDGWPHLICSLNGNNTKPPAQAAGFLRSHLVSVLADFIINIQAEPYLQDILSRNYFYFPRHERQEIIRYAEKIRQKETCGDNQQKVNNDVYIQLEQFLSQYDYLNIHGLIVFRLGFWLNHLKNCLDLAVDEFLMEKEYQEFIRLLKYFVQLQEPKIYQVHVTFDESGNLLLLDQNHNEIECSEHGVQWESLSGDKEDMLVSTLITVAPQRIVLHRQVYVQYPKAADTLKHVFEKRVLLCKHCKICHNASDSLDLKS